MNRFLTVAHVLRLSRRLGEGQFAVGGSGRVWHFADRCVVKRFESIGNTSDINRYGMMFTPGALWSGYEQSWEHGLPANLGHDLHALIGWNVPYGLYFNPKRTAFVLEIQIPETKEENANLRELGQGAWQHRLTEEVAPHLDELKKRLGGALEGNVHLQHPSCAALSGPGLARRRFPELFAQEDADGLVPLVSLTVKAPGVFEKDGLLLFAHPYFRRSLSRMNTFNSPFLQEFQTRDMPGCIRKIRLDPDMVGLPETYRGTIELAYWRGPLFKDDLTSIPKGVTQYQASEAGRKINGVGLTEFRWNELGGKRSFECEELRDSETLGAGAGRFGCRYVHTMLADTGNPGHADGAIRMYDEEGMVARLDKDIVRAGKKTIYTKLWRIDGELPVPLWKALVAHYYRDNPQVGEYLGGDADPDLLIDAPAESEAVSRPNLPPLLAEAAGVHVTAFMKRAEGAASSEPQVSLLAWDRMSCGPETQAYYESDAVDVCKALRAGGLKVLFPADASRVDWRDGVFNFPSALHDGPSPELSAARTIAACRDMFARWRDEGGDLAVTITIGVRLGGQELWTSCAGRLGPVIRWLEHPASKLPGELSAMMKWCDRVQGGLRELFPEVDTAPGIEEVSAIIRRSGALRFRRLFVGPEEWKQEKTERGTRILARPPRGEEKGIVDGGYQPTVVREISSSKCLRCEKEFIDCPCSSAEGGEEVTDWKAFCLSWGRPSKARP